MNIKKCICFFIKMAISGVLALTILSLLCLVYYNPPLAVAQPEGYTNYKLTPNASWRFMTEGNGGGVINSAGYNDPQDPIEGKKTICVLGSSHTEALQVDSEKNFVSRLETMVTDDADATNDYQCLNLGISGHFFDVVVSNFQNFANSYEDVSYVVIEVNNIEFSQEALEKMRNEEYHTELEEHSFVHKALQRIPYLRLLVKQYNDLQMNSAAAPAASAEPQSFENYEALLEPVMQKLAQISKEKNFQLVILHHNHVAFDENNQAYVQHNAQAQQQFQQSCEKNGIRYISTDDAFCQHANTYRELPYGFSNTRPGTGHLNEVGHELIAQVLYKALFVSEGV